ncbi:hypothetical protein COA17_12710 [Sphingomonas ginsenosidimutans]|jgi:hypothetical protein|uniref:Uncharacterized protein n=1 Tax=Sphingomonas ginsenosidimutans TaxID=862134 RepID=A0A2A4HXA4_9SPHN|nr:hypothetical protein [Sphingomonas ginsenosidimutans]PCG08529.1 hypothetical protein COA17_12710 [Sphingomonas ginsenosidimutans]
MPEPITPPPAAGQVWSFRTRPFTTFSPPHTGRYGAFKIIGVADDMLGVAVLSGVWRTPPAAMDVVGAPVLHEHRFAFRGKPAVFGARPEELDAPGQLDALAFVADQPVSEEEETFFATLTGFGRGAGFGELSNVDIIVEGEWRWANDRDALAAELDQEEEREEAQREAAAQRFKTRLSTLSWAQLAAETPLARWQPSPAFPPPAFIDGARAMLRAARAELAAMGEKPRKPAVRAVLKRTVEWFNDADDAAGGVIGTDEREDIVAALVDIAYAARQPALVDDIDTWRQW